MFFPFFSFCKQMSPPISFPASRFSCLERFRSVCQRESLVTLSFATVSRSHKMLYNENGRLKRKIHLDSGISFHTLAYRSKNERGIRRAQMLMLTPSPSPDQLTSSQHHMHGEEDGQSRVRTFVVVGEHGGERTMNAPARRVGGRGSIHASGRDTDCRSEERD